VLGGMFFQPGDGHGHFIGQPPLFSSRQFAETNQMIPHPIACCPELLFEPSTLRARDSAG